jgi:hypothetical protein
MNFIDCMFFDVSGGKYVLNFWNGNHYTKFDGCKFCGFADTPNAFVGFQSGAANFSFSFENCEVEAAAHTAMGGSGLQSYLNINNKYEGNPYYQVRRFIAPWTYDARLLGSSGYTNYHVAVPNWGVANITISGAAINGTTQVLTFTAASAADWAVGDIITWNVVDRSGVNTIPVPAYQIQAGGISGTAITAQPLVSNIVIPGTYPTTVSIAMPLFFNPTPSTGSTHTNTTLDSVTNITNWAIGDWIQGAGIPNYTRITNISGTTITLSKAATATATGVSIYNCGLTAY